MNKVGMSWVPDRGGVFRMLVEALAFPLTEMGPMTGC